MLVLGEGEISAYEAVEAIRLGKDLTTVEGIAFKNSSNEYIETKHRQAAKIDDLPMINWDFFDVERYLELPETIQITMKIRWILIVQCQ